MPAILQGGACLAGYWLAGARRAWIDEGRVFRNPGIGAGHSSADLSFKKNLGSASAAFRLIFMLIFEDSNARL